ncbi:MAG: acyltransferase [Muribaculaceae bacterium]|nr:acyltransferase [Muribaculaceae bacterium]
MTKDCYKERESNIELLRIVSILMVVLVHMDGAALELPAGNIDDLSIRDAWQLAVQSMVCIGVNCFTLISGYFGIRLRWQSVGSYLFQCVFYAVIIAGAACLMKPDKFGVIYWLESWLVLTHTDLWYVPAYFVLMLLSPIINGGMASLCRRQNVVLVSAFVIFNVWAGWLWGGKFNPTGYTPMQLIMVYMIGRVMAMYRRPSVRESITCGALYIFTSVLIFISAFYLSNDRAFAYNSPLMLLSSVLFFYIFLGIKVQSRTINFIAKSAFAVYLVHKAPVVWGGFIKPFMAKQWLSLSLAEYSALMLIMALLIYVAVIIPDYCQKRLWDAVWNRLKRI